MFSIPVPIESLLIDSILAIVPCIVLLHGKKLSMQQAFSEIKKEFGLHFDGIIDFKRTLVLTAILLIVSIILSTVFLSIGFTDLEKVGNVIEKLKQTQPALLIYLLVARVFVEEFFFRGFLSKKTGALVSSLAFAAAHFTYGSMAEVIGAFVLGYILAKAFEKNKTLVPNILAHMLYNVFTLLLLLA